jgi:hypothetical protein
MLIRSLPVRAALKSKPAPIVEVELISPSSAPHLLRIARELESVIAGKLDMVLSDPDACARFAAGIVEADKEREAFDRFREVLRRRLVKADA